MKVSWSLGKVLAVLGVVLILLSMGVLVEQAYAACNACVTLDCPTRVPPALPGDPCPPTIPGTPDDCLDCWALDGPCKCKRPLGGALVCRCI